MKPSVRVFVTAAAGLALILIYWTIEALRNPPIALPPPGTVLAKVGDLLTSTEFLVHAGVTVMIFLQGFVPAVAVAVGLGLVASKAQPARWLVDALTVVPAAAPLIVLAPALVLLQGIGAPSKIVLVFIVSTFPMLHTFVAVLKSRGVHSVPLAILSSLRIGLMLGVGAAVVGEMLAASQGLGYLVTLYASNFDAASMLATMVVILLPTALIGTILQAFEETSWPDESSDMRS